MQRAYNAFAVRVQDTEPPTPGGGVRGGGGTGAGTRRIVPAGETAEGMLCIEMRIRLYHDGAMSKLLEKLANVGCNSWYILCVCVFCVYVCVFFCVIFVFAFLRFCVLCVCVFLTCAFCVCVREKRDKEEESKVVLRLSFFFYVLVGIVLATIFVFRFFCFFV